MGKKKKKEFEGFRKSEKSPYKTIKTTLKSLLRNKTETLPCINNLVYELNDLVIHSYQFIRLYVLECYNNKGLRKLIHKKYDTITINECYTSQKCCDCFGDLEYYRNKQMKKEFRLLVCSNCVSCENKKTVFRIRDANSAINIMKLTKLWIEKQQRPCEFQKSNSSFTISDKKEMEKVRQS